MQLLCSGKLNGYCNDNASKSDGGFCVDLLGQFTKHDERRSVFDLSSTLCAMEFQHGA